MTKEEFLTMVSSRYEELNELGALDNFYDYEKSFDAIWQDLGRMYLERTLEKRRLTVRIDEKKNANQIWLYYGIQITSLHASA